MGEDEGVKATTPARGARAADHAHRMHDDVGGLARGEPAGYALFALKRHREAEASLRFALNMASQEPAQDEEQKKAQDQVIAQIHLNLGLVLMAEGRKEEAKLELRQARKLAPDSPSARDAT